MVDAFDVLGMEASFDLDAEALRRAWLRKSLDAHPDRAGGDDAARELAARLNEARRTLEDEESRADALLVRLGGPAKETEKSLPDGFLMEIMELREGLESAQMAGDRAALKPHRERAERERARRLERVRELFSSELDDSTLRAIRVELNAWRYLERMLEQIEAPPGPLTGDGR